MPTSDLAAVARRPILGDTANRYKRNAMILALIIAGIHFTPYVNFEHLNIFGVQIGAGVGSRRFLVLLVLWLTLGYTAGWCAYYCWLDWRRWLSDLTARGDHDHFPEFAMFWGALPSDTLTQRFFGHEMAGFKGWERGDSASHIHFQRRIDEGKRGQVLRKGFSVSKIVAAEVRENYRALQVQLLFAGLCATAAGAGLLWELARWVISGA